MSLRSCISLFYYFSALYYLGFALAEHLRGARKGMDIFISFTTGVISKKKGNGPITPRGVFYDGVGYQY